MVGRGSAAAHVGCSRSGRSFRRHPCSCSYLSSGVFGVSRFSGLPVGAAKWQFAIIFAVTNSAARLRRVGQGEINRWYSCQQVGSNRGYRYLYYRILPVQLNKLLLNYFSPSEDLMYANKSIYFNTVYFKISILQSMSKTDSGDNIYWFWSPLSMIL